MPTVNFSHVENLLSQLLTLHEDTFDRLEKLDPEDKQGMREIFAGHLLPIYRRLRPHGQAKLKQSLQYFLNTRSDVPGKMMAQLQDVPLSSDHPYPVLEALWDALFAGEDHRLANLAGYVENNDDDTGNEIFAPDGGWPQ